MTIICGPYKRRGKVRKHMTITYGSHKRRGKLCFCDPSGSLQVWTVADDSGEDGLNVPIHTGS
jgi:hypothetical protein